jgi:ADP-heptose:LPS heptosyltransferase
MGVGDWIMATAQAKKLHEANGRPVLVCRPNGVPMWNEVFENNPRIAKAHGRNTQKLINSSGARPYIAGKTTTHWIWKRWDISPGEIYLSAAERTFAEPHGGSILVEPNTKVQDGNKAWPWDRWQALVDRGGNFVQVGAAGARQLRGVHFVETPTFRLASAVLAASRAFVGSEGGLHHAAAAFGVPAVVLFSEFISPEITGYKTHRNLRHAREACGSRLPCLGCKASMLAITVDEVSTNLGEILNEVR